VSLLYVMLVIPIIGIFCISTLHSFYPITVNKVKSVNNIEYSLTNTFPSKNSILNDKKDSCFVAMDSAAVNFYKKIAFIATILNLIVSLIIYMTFDFSNNQFQFIQENFDLSFYDIYLGVDGLSIYFILLTTIIMPIALVSNWNSIVNNIKSYLIIMLLLETLLLAVFLVLDVLLFYIFFESILPPLFILIGLFGSSNKVRASFYIFLYTFFRKCKRAKFRKSPKVLVTKYIRETLFMAWLMTQGMVISLKMKNKLFMQWVITDLNHFWFKVKYIQTINLKDVKEQRVDGSSKSRILDFVRCTLVVGKPVFERKIHSRYNNIIANINFKRSLHTTYVNKLEANSNLDPWFITGLVDAEGSFMLGFFKSDSYKMGYQIQAIFKMALHSKDLDLLSQVQKFFGIGKITKHGEASSQYTVKSLKDLEKIISHFDNYPLLGQKWADYTLFKSAVQLIKDKEHLNKQGFNKLLCIRDSMNLGLSEELKLNFPYIKPVSRPLLPKINHINPNWIAGLTSGDGCFHISIRNSPTTKLGKSIVLKFHIVQHSRDIGLMEMLISTFGCGRIELMLKQSAVYFVVTNFKDVFEKIIPLFNKYPIKGVKALDFAEFKKVSDLIHTKEHLTEEGLSKIQSIKLNMNSTRSAF
jgi:hypothetical protein